MPQKCSDSSLADLRVSESVLHRWGRSPGREIKSPGMLLKIPVPGEPVGLWVGSPRATREEMAARLGPAVQSAR